MDEVIYLNEAFRYTTQRVVEKWSLHAVFVAACIPLATLLDASLQRATGITGHVSWLGSGILVLAIWAGVNLSPHYYVISEHGIARARGAFHKRPKSQSSLLISRTQIGRWQREDLDHLPAVRVFDDNGASVRIVYCSSLAGSKSERRLFTWLSGVVAMNHL